ncbi:MAG: ABC transporter ATP-binding protein [Caldilineaceae bacterium]|nr:ABC transporter ATP-binding protein [Caldilineaceae bacterium]
MTVERKEAPLLETRNLTRLFGHGAETVRAVDGVSFAMQPGEIVAVVGESGSGKSTLARLVLRLLEPTAGQILLHGNDVTRIHRGGELKAYWRKVQGVFQDPFASFNQFYTIRSVLGNALNLLDGRITRQGRLARMEDALCEVGLDPEDVLYKWPHQLSGGQVQRVMIARALVVGPELLIADEPTSMLDASLRVTVLNVLRDLRAEHNMGILFITHDLGQACYVSDRILVMYRGQLVEQGPVEAVMANPQHRYTRQLLNDVPRLHAWGMKPLAAADATNHNDPTRLLVSAL